MLKFKYIDTDGKVIDSGKVDLPIDEAVEVVRSLVFPFRPDVFAAELRNLPGEAADFRRIYNSREV